MLLTASMELPADKSELMTAGFLSSLLGAGCECDGYNIEIVGHSLGGAVAALLGIRVSYIFYVQRIYYSCLLMLICHSVRSLTDNYILF
jgi:hypothetical protein